MIQLTKMQSQTLLEVFKQLHLPEDFIGQLEDYIDGKIGEEVLLKLPFQDLKKVARDPSSTFFLTLVKKEMTTEAKRYFDILFAIGGPSCSNMLPDDVMVINQDRKIGIEIDKIIAVYAYKNGERKISESNKKRFEEVTKGNTKLIQKALLYKNGQKESGKIILYALYFLFKYPDGKPAIPKGQKKKFSTGIHKFYQKKKNTAEELLQQEDQKLMQEYEDCMCRQVNYMLNQGLLSEEIRKITEALHQEELSDETKQLVRRHTVMFEVVKQNAGLAFMNFAFSNCLRNFLSLALFINRSAALEGMEAADFRKDLKFRGGNFDELFGIDTKKYILWAAAKYYKNILRVQFERNRESYIQCCDTASMQLSNRMVDVVKKQDVSFYQERKEIYLFERKEELLSAYQETNVVGRMFVLKLLADHAEENKKAILAFSKDSSKIVREALLEVLYQHTDWEEEIKLFLEAKKATEREVGIRVLAHWGIEKYQKELEQVLEKEKNSKISGLLAELLQLEQEEEKKEKVFTREDLVKECHKGGRACSLSWAYQTPFSVVHKKNKEEASKEYLQAIFLCYSAMRPCGVSSNAAFLAEELQAAEFAVYVNELFDKWIEAGAEAKKRWVLYAASIHGGIGIIKKLQHQIQEWPKYARGTIASEAVQALALNPDPQALLIVDGIARKFKFKQVKAAAGKALDFAAIQLGLEREELEDRIVPDLGFNAQMERVFDYGERSFTVTITTALEIEVLDEKKKKLKNLPAPGKKDDPEKAALAYKTFKQMKKQIKTEISSQKARLDWALSSERVWSVEAWEALFVKNPLMHPFAIGLIWGVYQDGELLQSFRYMEDGTFHTEEEEEFLLSKEGKIGLVHPIELSEESKTAWKEQLEDYKIVQPIVQLERNIFYLTEEEKASRSLERFGGYIVNDLSLSGKLQSFGWYQGSITDVGKIYTFYREDTKIGYGVELHFSGSFVGGGDTKDVTLYDARFYKAGKIDRSNYSYEELELEFEKGLLLSEIPKRYFSEIVLQLMTVTAFSKEKNKEWKKERG